MDDLSQTIQIHLKPDLELLGKEKKETIESDESCDDQYTTLQVENSDQVLDAPRKSFETSSDSRYEELFQSIYDAVLITDDFGNIKKGNPRAIHFLQYTEDELLNMNIMNCIWGSDTSFFNLLKQTLDKQFLLMEASCVRKDGSQFLSEIAVNKLYYEHDHFCFFIRNITRRHAAESLLHTIQNAVQNAVTGIAITDLKSNVEYVNPAVLKLWGYEHRADLKGNGIDVLLQASDDVKTMHNQLEIEQASWHGELNGIKQSQDVFPVEVAAAPNTNPEGQLCGFVFSFVDITDHKRAEEAIRETERQTAMLVSLGAACHHLAQPATVIMTNAELMKMISPSDNQEMLELIESNAGAAKELAGVLNKLNKVDHYRTMHYLEDVDRVDSIDNTILDIDG